MLRGELKPNTRGVFEQEQKLTATSVLLWILSWTLHTKALSHDPAPEGPLPVLHPGPCTQHGTDQQLHLLCSKALHDLSDLFFSASLICIYSMLPVPPSHKLLKIFPPSLPAGDGLPLPPHADDPPLLGSQHRSAFNDGCRPFLGERQVMFLIWRAAVCVWIIE